MKQVGFTIHPGETTEAWVRRTVAGLVARALRESSCRGSGRDKQVHDVRVAVKQLRALLRLVRPALGPAAFVRGDGRLKMAARRLAPARDPVAAARAMQCLAAEKGGRKLPVFPVSADREAGTRRAVRLSADRALDLSRRDLERFRNHILRLSLRRTGWEMIHQQIAGSYRKARTRMERALENPDAAAFHRWRSAVKRLCYQLAWFEVVRPKRFGRMIRRLDKLGSRLGDDHDLTVLRDMVQAAPGRFGGAEALSAVHRAAARRSRRLRAACRRKGMDVFHESPRRFERHCRRWWKEFCGPKRLLFPCG